LILVAVVAVSAQDTFDSDGKPFAKAYNRTRTPKVMVDTIRFAGQFVSMDLRSSFSDRNHAVSGTSNLTVLATITPILDDSTQALYYYGYCVVDKGTRLVIKSSNANDSSKVVVVARIK